ncbi:MAG: hypothetical protein AAF726_09760 [Planctomycetota bacterium]
MGFQSGAAALAIEPQDALERDERRFRRWLAGLAAIGLLTQALLVSGAFESNPYARQPVMDAKYFWSFGERIAGGQWVQDEPFFSAPLYPYFVGLVRALGGGLVALAVVQGLLLVSAALLLAIATRRIAGVSAGAVAGALLLLTTEAALGTSRVLGGTLQLFLLAALLERATALSSKRELGSAGGLGLVAGLTTLAWPVFLAGLPFFAAWVGRITRLRTGALFLAVAAATIAPATIHNFVVAREVIPISAHAGITFWHGNNPQADGVFVAVDVANDKDTYHTDALAQARAALGADAGWTDASDYFLGKGLDWWADDPLHATGVAFRKLWYTLSGRTYGDVYLLSLERRDGLVPFAWLAPLPVALYLPFGLVIALVLLARGPLRRIPIAVLVGLPVAVCVAFWYTPRYRLPAIPGLCLCAAMGVQWLTGHRVGAKGSVLLGLALAMGVLSGALNRALGFDSSAALERAHLERTSALFARDEEYEPAAEFLRRASEAAPEDPSLRRNAFDLLRWVGRELDAVALLRTAPESTMRDPGFRSFLAWTLATTPSEEAHDAVAATTLAEGALAALGGADPFALDSLGAAQAATGEFDAAIETTERALALVSEDDAYRSDLEARIESYARGQAWRDLAASGAEAENETED